LVTKQSYEILPLESALFGAVLVSTSDTLSVCPEKLVNEHPQGARWERQSLFKILRRPYNGS
jgi:hypothetical protein